MGLWLCYLMTSYAPPHAAQPEASFPPSSHPSCLRLPSFLHRFALPLLLPSLFLSFLVPILQRSIRGSIRSPSSCSSSCSCRDPSGGLSGVPAPQPPSTPTPTPGDLQTSSHCLIHSHPSFILPCALRVIRYPSADECVPSVNRTYWPPCGLGGIKYQITN